MRKREVITAVATVVGIMANMIILWNITTWEIIEILFCGIICFWLEVCSCIMFKEFLQHYTEWRQAEKLRIAQAKARKHRKEGSWDYDLRGAEEDMWYEVLLDEAM